MLYITNRIAPRNVLINVLVPCFSTYCFQISGSKFLLGKLIELPLICGATSDTAEVVAQLLQDFEAHKQTDQYKAAVSRSEKRAEDQQKLSREIWWARYDLEQGRLLSAKVSEGRLNFFRLNWHDQRQSLRTRIKNDES